ncbi:MAG: cation transporter [Rectinemataceae bacterium]|jgi:divalent metal cation (Fe/Co/Zn/Cd) transporter
MRDGAVCDAARYIHSQIRHRFGRTFGVVLGIAIGGAFLRAASLTLKGVAADLVLTRPAADTAPLGLGVAAASSVLMPILARAKRRIGKRIGSKALEADGSCSMVCAYMSWIVLAGVIATAVMGWWWLDSLAALGLVYFVVHEGIEAIETTRTRHY